MAHWLEWKGSRLRRGMMALVISLLSFSFLMGCQSDAIVSTGNTQFFVQNLSPQYLDVLWVIDDRSPMNRVRERLVAESQHFFTRLDAAAVTYRMAFISADMAFSKGRLKPDSSPVILTKESGLDVQARANYFGSILSQIINLHTGSEDRGFEAALTALSQSFVPRTGAPLVLVFISDADDHSSAPSGQSVVSYYERAFLSLLRAAIDRRFVCIPSITSGWRVGRAPPIQIVAPPFTIRISIKTRSRTVITNWRVGSPQIFRTPTPPPRIYVRALRRR